MQEYVHTLQTINKGIDSLEDEHNEVVDTQASVQTSISEHSESLRKDLIRVHNDITQLRTSIHERISKAKRATVILGLLAQKEELKPIQNRADKQPYELYARSEWFRSLLQDRLDSSKSNP
jgi:predicted  nucleic acid-binding Zn-ribbon protein